MIHPVPRPALRKSPDANLHPAAPGRPGLRLAAAERAVPSPPVPAAAPAAAPPTKSGKAGKPEKQKSADKAAKSGKSGKPGKPGKSDKGRKSADPARTQPAPAPAKGAVPAARSRLSGPLAGKTSDSLRAAPKRQRAGRKAPKEKLVELRVKVPKALRKDLRSAAKSTKRSEDAIVTALLRGWLGS